MMEKVRHFYARVKEGLMKVECQKAIKFFNIFKIQSNQKWSKVSVTWKT